MMMMTMMKMSQILSDDEIIDKTKTKNSGNVIVVTHTLEFLVFIFSANFL